MSVILFMPESYRLASAEERNFYCNGCGTKGLGGWLVPDTLWGLNITPVCDIHDWMYKEGITLEDKERADRVMLNNMLRIIDASTGWAASLFRALRRQRAMKYYSAVRDLGGLAYWSGKNKPEDEGTLHGSN